MLVPLGHHVLLHGRNPAKLEQTEKALSALPGAGRVASYVADLSNLSDVVALAKAVTEKHGELDVLVNNAWVFKTSETRTQDGLDVRFAENTIAPYLLTNRLLPLFGPSARVINVSSAAQSPVDPKALAEEFATASGRYFDNDSGRFGSPHADALDQKKMEGIVRVVEAVLAEKTKTGAEQP